MLSSAHQLTAALYLVASVLGLLSVALPTLRVARFAGPVLGAGFAAHVLTFGLLHTLDPPPPLTSLPAAISLMAAVAVLFCLVLGRRGRLASLAAPVAPVAFVAVFYASLVLPGAPPATDAGGSWPHLHVILASAGLGLLGVAGIAGALFLASERRLKTHRPTAWGGRLPSLEALDRVNLMALAVGFPLLTLGVLAGMLWLRTTHGTLWRGGAHETWCLVAWFVYVGLALARFGIGWRGREAAVSAAAGFFFLLVAVIGVGALT